MSVSDEKLIEFECGLCHGIFEFNRRRLREFRQRQVPPLCQVCQLLSRIMERRPPAEMEKHFAFWFEKFPGEALEELLEWILGPEAVTAEGRERRRVLRERILPPPAVAA